MRIASNAHTDRAIHKAYFERIESKNHWKEPIHALIPSERFQEFDLAVAYFHGEGLTVVSESDGWTEVKNQGYVCWKLTFLFSSANLIADERSN